MHSPQQLIELYDLRFSGENFNTSPSGLYEAVGHVMKQKGKRIRPLLALMACEMFGGNAQDALTTAFGLEVFHNFTLVHDDIMDQSDVRRGLPTVHKKFGLNAGILAGDVMLVYVYKYFAEAPAACLLPILNSFTETAVKIFEGQQMDVDFEIREIVTEAEYLKMIEYKTSVLLACALQLGAIIAGAAIEDQRYLYDFGLKLGLSFQIKDDYLDAFGETEKVGKRIGGDILMNKKTYLMVAAQHLANDDQKLNLLQLEGEKDEEKKIMYTKELFEKTGARKKTVDRADSFYHESIQSLQKINCDALARSPLAALAEKINNREF